MARRIKIFDTTLRDGEQSPGCSMNLEEKIEIAKQLEKLNVDVIEAGFAISSKGDFESVMNIAKTLKNTTVTSLARALEKDIDVAYEAVKYAVSPRIHTFISTSPVHMQYKLRMSPEEVIEKTAAMVAYAKKYVSDIQFSAEDATRTEPEFLARVVQTAIKAGATVINIPDTVGFTTPNEMFDLIKYLKQNVSNIDKAELAVHCHNDLGMAVANSLAAVQAGASQIECTVNGLGERAGNAALEEIVMALNTRKPYFDIDCEVNTKQIYRTSRLVYNIIGMTPPINKAIVGTNAFAHESGIHQHGVLAEKSTYEIMTPESIGLKTNNMVLGKHSGRHAFEDKLIELGYDFTQEEINTYFEKFKELCDKKKQVNNNDIIAIVTNKMTYKPGTYELDRFDVHASNKNAATCVIVLKADNEFTEEVAIGDGPINAAYNAIDKIVSIKGHSLENYSINSVSDGTDALGEVVVKIRYNDNTYIGRGLSTDIIESSILAYVNGINKIIEMG
ncbi:MAG: 2-isopropylmalate synthase [Clostridiales bacterium]|nr:2-isopropylmalate synthase [Clostridiales bacterium]